MQIYKPTYEPTCKAIYKPTREAIYKAMVSSLSSNDPATVEVLNLLMWHSLVFGCECNDCRVDANNYEIIADM